jgi:uncharacterized repeat protein (TIGR03943 family)
MEEDRSLRKHYVLRALIMAGYALYVVYLVQAGKLAYYIAPRMMLYVKLAAIGFVVFACCQFFAALHVGKGQAAACCPEHMPSRSRLKNTTLYSLFLLPLALGVMLPDKMMGSDIASVKGMNLSSGTSVQMVGAKSTPLTKPTRPADGQEEEATSPAPSTSTLGQALQGHADDDPIANGAGSLADVSDERLLKLFEHDRYSEDFARLAVRLYREEPVVIQEEGFLELLGAVDMYKKQFTGKRLTISGFIYREEGMEPNQFVVSRLAMQCCSADSAPYGVMVETAGPTVYAEDTWVSVTGTVGATEYDGVEIMKLASQEIHKIPVPQTPYVYPYLGNVLELAP